MSMEAMAKSSIGQFEGFRVCRKDAENREGEKGEKCFHSLVLVRRVNASPVSRARRYVPGAAESMCLANH